MNQKATALVKHVTLVGGTHGNEITGTYCLEHWQAPSSSSFTLSKILANPKAAEANTRFIDRDLNRCFAPSVLEDPALASAWEVQRAQQIIEQINQEPEPTDFIIDLHTTTANMGVTLIFEQANWLTYCILQHVQASVSNVHLMYEPAPADGLSQYLINAAPQGMMIEVGPVAQGLLSATCYEQTVKALEQTLHAIDFYNALVAPNPQDWLKEHSNLQLDVFQSDGMIEYPTNTNGTIAGYTHPNFQHQDYKPLKPGMPIFKNFSGATIPYEGTTCYPVFINEAAYYNQKLAFTCAQKKQLSFDQAPSMINKRKPSQ